MSNAETATIKELQRRIFELESLLTEREGMVWVPKEPTDKMIKAGHGWREWDENKISLVRAYKSMLAAAPKTEIP